MTHKRFNKFSTGGFKKVFDFYEMTIIATTPKRKRPAVAVKKKTFFWKRTKKIDTRLRRPHARGHLPASFTNIFLSIITRFIFVGPAMEKRTPRVRRTFFS